MNAVLALEDGTWYRGVAAGASGEARGEVVFNTSMTGYQEVLTDPSYAGQIVTMTAPHIGNYGVAAGDVESQTPQVAGFVMREASPLASNWRADATLRDYLVRHNIVAIADIDTRALTRVLRSAGVMRGIIATVADLIDKRPIFGICLGHQILSIVLGAKTHKMPFGHHGANHPVKDLETGKVEITSQNHGFAVDVDSLAGKAKLTHVNLNDHTVEGMRLEERPVFSVQYHPEASPGPHDAAYLFRRFLELMRS
jgi:carbamoylphosphate synthase small subunit